MGNPTVQRSNTTKIKINKRPLLEQIVKRIWTTCSQIARKNVKRDEHYLFCRMQQYTSGTHGNILTHLVISSFMDGIFESRLYLVWWGEICGFGDSWVLSECSRIIGRDDLVP